MHDHTCTCRVSSLLLTMQLQQCMWSVGCVFAEMATGVPLFAGRSDVDHEQARVRNVPPHHLFRIDC